MWTRLVEWTSRVRFAFSRRRVDDEARGELEAHLEQLAERYMRGGMTPREARAAAERQFGSASRVREEIFRMNGIGTIDALARDLRYALRGIRRAPGLAAIVILTLALGIGANAAIFSLMDQVLLRALPVPEPDELVLLDGPGIFQGRTDNPPEVFSVPMFRGLEAAAAPVLTGLFARYTAPVALTIDAASERVQAELVSGHYFGTLGVGVARGRGLGRDDDRVPGGHPVVVLSHAYWRSRLGGDEQAIGGSIQVNGHAMTVVGIAAAGFGGVDLSKPADLFMPLMMKGEVTPTWNDLENWRSRWVNVVGRLRPGVSREQAGAALNVAYRQLLQEDVKTARLSTDDARARFLAKALVVMPGGRGRSTVRAAFETPLLVLMGMVGVVLRACRRLFEGPCSGSTRTFPSST